MSLAHVQRRCAVRPSAHRHRCTTSTRVDVGPQPRRVHDLELETAQDPHAHARRRRHVDRVVVGDVLHETRDRVEPHAPVRPDIAEPDPLGDRDDTARSARRRARVSCAVRRDARRRPKASANTASLRRPGATHDAARAPRRVAARAPRPSVPAASTATAIRRSIRSVCEQAELLAERLRARAHRRDLRHHVAAAPTRPRHRSPHGSASTPVEEPDLREVFLGEWEGGEFRARAAAGDPIFAQIFDRGAVGRHPGCRAARRLRRARVATASAHRRRASRPARDGRRRTAA